MSLRIDQDHSRFRNIVRGRIRQNLRKYISKGELLGRQGKDLVSIPSFLPILKSPFLTTISLSSVPPLMSPLTYFPFVRDVVYKFPSILIATLSIPNVQEQCVSFALFT